MSYNILSEIKGKYKILEEKVADTLYVSVPVKRKDSDGDEITENEEKIRTSYDNFFNFIDARNRQIGNHVYNLDSESDPRDYRIVLNLTTALLIYLDIDKWKQTAFQDIKKIKKHEAQLHIDGISKTIDGLQPLVEPLKALAGSMEKMIIYKETKASEN